MRAFPFVAKGLTRAVCRSLCHPTLHSASQKFLQRCFSRQLMCILQITVTDSHGGRHKELVKSGNDDMRQDAVMQQFFKLVNHVLRADAATRKRQLSIRTYKVSSSPTALAVLLVHKGTMLSDLRAQGTMDILWVPSWPCACLSYSLTPHLALQIIGLCMAQVSFCFTLRASLNP